MRVPPIIGELTETPPPGAREAIAGPLLDHHRALLGDPGIRPLAVLLRGPDQAEVIGGLWGRTSWGWLYVELLHLPEALRGRGLGATILRQAEREAMARGCRDAWLETLSAAAAEFYRRQGYMPFGRLADYPPGNTRQFLTKRLGG